MRVRSASSTCNSPEPKKRGWGSDGRPGYHRNNPHARAVASEYKARVQTLSLAAPPSGVHTPSAAQGGRAATAEAGGRAGERAGGCARRTPFASSSCDRDPSGRGGVCTPARPRPRTHARPRRAAGDGDGDGDGDQPLRRSGPAAHGASRVETSACMHTKLQRSANGICAVCAEWLCVHSLSAPPPARTNSPGRKVRQSCGPEGKTDGEILADYRLYPASQSSLCKMDVCTLRARPDFRLHRTQVAVPSPVPVERSGASPWSN